MDLKRFSVELDQKLIKDCVSVTGINSLNSLISHALQELLGRDGPGRTYAVEGADYLGGRSCQLAPGKRKIVICPIQYSR